MSERINLKEIIDNDQNLTSHLLLEFADSEKMSELVGSKDYDIESVDFKITVNNVEVSSSTFEDFLQFIWQHVETEYCEPEDSRIKKKAKDLIKEKADELYEKMCDISDNLEWCSDKILGDQ